ncbi:MAG TPA: TetR/AcrR family transcriptional regulator [Archangium sp.]|uniref:TetR/AcrR family transcriptional regulator n=1 Tax=Archangium sp. TaxID=1872627 RepID=UPI002E319142|nr:TetR/AcrR family transcriptional regulator [Archangium sp.]HEX5749581.1 TetR/AcrR family transcriptional regulator [Archangium sp.]
MERRNTKARGAAAGPGPRRAPGRPRDERIDEEVRAATLALLREGGYGALSLEAVAERAGVGRPTLYRRWAGKPQLVVDTLVRSMGEAPAADTGDTREDLVSGLSTLTAAFAGAVGRALPGLVADLAVEPALAQAFRERVFATRRASMAAALARGVARGDIRGDIDVELVLDLLAAPLYYRVLFGHAPIQGRTAGDVVDLVLRAVAPETAPAQRTAPPGAGRPRGKRAGRV